MRKNPKGAEKRKSLQTAKTACRLSFLAEWVGFEPTVPEGTTDFEGRETAKTSYISAQVRIKYLPQACKNGLFSYLVIYVRITLQLHFSRPGTIWAPRAPFRTRRTHE